MTPTTRYLCPLCDWHHDETTPDFSNPDAAHPFVKQTWPSGVDGLVAGLAAGQAAVAEAAVKAHLETHPLIEWARALAEERRDRADAARGVEIAMDEWGKSDQRHAKESVAFAAERGAWGTTRMRVWNAALIADEVDVTDWQRGYRACSQRVMAALNEPVDTVIYDFNAPLRTPETTSGESPDKAATSDNGPDIAGES